MTGELRLDPIKAAVFAERDRCARVVEGFLNRLQATEAVNNETIGALQTVAQDIRVGKRPRHRPRYVCSYCEGDGHNRSTCEKRKAEEAAAKGEQS